MEENSSFKLNCHFLPSLSLINFSGWTKNIYCFFFCNCSPYLYKFNSFIEIQRRPAVGILSLNAALFRIMKIYEIIYLIYLSHSVCIYLYFVPFCLYFSIFCSLPFLSISFCLYLSIFHSVPFVCLYISLHSVCISLYFVLFRSYFSIFHSIPFVSIYISFCSVPIYLHFIPVISIFIMTENEIAIFGICVSTYSQLKVWVI